MTSETYQQTSELITDSLRPIRERYWADVRDYAAEIIEENQSDEERYDAAMSYADSSQWSIYTREAYLVALVSDNPDAWENVDPGLHAECEGQMDQIMSMSACYALAQDINDEIAVLLMNREKAADQEWAAS